MNFSNKYSGSIIYFSFSSIFCFKKLLFYKQKKEKKKSKHSIFSIYFKFFKLKLYDIEICLHT